MKSRLAAALVSIAFLIGLTGCGKEETAATPVRTVLVDKVSATGVVNDTGYSGEIRARYESDIGFRIGGKIVARLVDIGAAVKVGQPLARLDGSDAALQVTQANANRTLAEAELKRYRELREKNFVSQSALDAHETSFKAANVQAGLARNQASYTTLAADHDGVVTAVLAEVGQVVGAGQTVVRIARPEEKELAVSIPEGQVETLRQAKALTVSPWTQPELQLPGRLREIAPAADAATRTYAARIAITEAPASLRLGMTARVSLPPASGDGGLLVPATAVVDQGQGPAVWVVANDRANRRPVQVLKHREDGVLLSGGLKPGELIVVVGAHKLLPDQAVRPILQSSAAPGTAR